MSAAKIATLLNVQLSNLTVSIFQPGDAFISR